MALLRTSWAHFHLARGHGLTALRERRGAGRLVSATISNPYCYDWRSAAALALSALGRRDEARALAEDELADARRFAIPEAEGSSRRTLGLVVAGAEGEARDLLRAALDETARMGASALADRAHEELVAAGARPRRDRRTLSGPGSATTMP